MGETRLLRSLLSINRRLQGWMLESFVLGKRGEGEGGCIVLAMALGVDDPWGRGGDADPSVAAQGVTEPPTPPPMCQGRDQGQHTASCPGSPVLSLAPSLCCDAQQ